MSAFPLITFALNTRRLVGSGLIPEFVGELRATVEAANRLTASAAKLAALIDGLFGDKATDEEPDPGTPAVPVPVQARDDDRGTLRRRWVLWRVKREAEREYRTNGLSSVRAELDALGVPTRMSAWPDPRWRIEGVWPAAVAAGVEDVIWAELARIPGYGEIAADVVGGPVIDWLKRAAQWVWDHREEILAVVRILLLFLAFI